MKNIRMIRNHNDDTDPFDNIPAFLKRHDIGAPADEEQPDDCPMDDDDEAFDLQLDDGEDIDNGEDFSLAGDDDDDSFGEFDASEIFGHNDEFSYIPTYKLQTADDYHQRVSLLMRRNMYHQAIEVCNAGLKLFELDMPLIACRSYSNTCICDFEAAEADIERMLAVPFEKWDWHCFVACLECWMRKPVVPEGQCRRMLDDFKRCFPELEMPYLQEHELEQKLGNKTRAYDVLNDAVAHQGRCTMCACELAEKQLEDTDYTAAMLTCRRGIRGSFQLEPSESMPKLNAVHFCALCGQMYEHFDAGHTVPSKAIKQLIRMGCKLLKYFDYHNDDTRAVHRCIPQLKLLKAECLARECLPVYGGAAKEANHA